MTRRYALRAQLFGVFFTRVELDLAVAQHIGIGRAPRSVLCEELLENARIILRGKIHGVNGYSQLVRRETGIRPVLVRGTGAVLVLPVVHEKADDFVSLFDEERGGYRAVHSAAHSHSYFHYLLRSRAAFLFSALFARAAKSAREYSSRRSSGCHCTPTKKDAPGRYAASVTPSSDTAAAPLVQTLAALPCRVTSVYLARYSYLCPQNGQNLSVGTRFAPQCEQNLSLALFCSLAPSVGCAPKLGGTGGTTGCEESFDLSLTRSFAFSVSGEYLGGASNPNGSICWTCLESG